MKRKAVIIMLLLITTISATAQKRKPKIKIKTTAKTIQMGDTVKFIWLSENLDSLHLLTPKTKLDLNGNFTMTFDTSTNINFRAYRKKQSIQKKINIIVERPYVIVTASDNATDENPAVIKWTSKNVQKLRLLQYSDSLPANGEIKLLLAKSDTLHFEAVNKNGYVKKASVFVKVKLKEYLEYPQKTIECTPVTIKWKYKNTARVLLLPLDTSFKNTDSVVIAPLFGTDYKIVQIKENGDSLVYPIKMEVSPQDIIFTANKNILFRGNTVTISWNTPGLKDITISELKGGQKTKGSVTLKPLKSTTYSLTGTNCCTNKQVNKDITVYVIERKYIKGVKDFKDLKPGVRLNAEIFASDFSSYPDEVKLYVLVVDTAGNYITNLEKASQNNTKINKFFLKITESIAGKVNHQVEHFTVKEYRDVAEPIDINLTLDYSGSMCNAIDQLEKAVKTFIEKKHDADRISMVRFDDSLALECPLLRDKKEILDKVKFDELTYFGGWTALYAGADMGLNTVFNSPFKNNRFYLQMDTKIHHFNILVSMLLLPRKLH